MKVWVGKWVIAVAILHCAFGLFKHLNQFKDMFSTGFWASANSSDTKLAIWFVFFGVVFLVLGQLINFIENSDQNIPKASALILLAMVIAGAVSMPVSGFWLLFPPVIVMLLRKEVCVSKKPMRP